MERPTLNPLVYADLEAAPPRPPTLGQRLWTLPRLGLRFLLSDIAFWSNKPRLQIEDASPLSRILWGLSYRLLFVPLAAAAVVAAFVYLGTHSARSSGITDPLSKGTYFDPVSFVSGDGMRLEAWFVPAIEARTVIDEQDEALRRQRPGVILVHDDGATRLQMLPLVQPLHEAGYVVLVTSLRGVGGANSATTFGLREAADVQAAAEFLRRRPGIDPKRIAILGIGTGANAALLAAARDPEIAAVVLDHPILNVDQMLAERIGPPQPWLMTLRPACKWIFELAYRVDAEDLDVDEHMKDLGKRQVLHFKDAASLAESFHRKGLDQIRDFLARSMPEPTPAPLQPASGTASIEIK